VEQNRKVSLLLHVVEEETPDRTIIFTRTKARADRLAKTLGDKGLEVGKLHGDLRQQKREQILRRFRDGSFPIMIATDVAARGIDISDVSHVINFDVPQNAEDYVHRIGRTGRMGKRGVAHTFVTPEDGEFLTAIEKLINQEVPVRTYAQQPSSVRELWLSTAAFAERDYLVYYDERWSYADAHREVASIAAWLAEHGVAPGDRVAIAMRNFPEWILAYWAITSMGAVVVGMNAWWIGSEIVYAVQDSQPKVVFCDAERLERMLEHRDDVPEPWLVGVRLDGAAPAGVVPYAEVRSSGASLPEATIDPDSDACIFYTSGTTGRPKGAQLTHRGCVANVMNIAFSGACQQRVAELRGEADEGAAAAPPVALITTPLFHVTANNCAAYATTLAGGTMVLMYKWDAGEALELIERERVTNMSGVPVMARELISHPDFPHRDTSSLQVLGGGGAQLQPDLVQRIDDSVATAKPNTGYGMTETCGIITAISGEFFLDRPESAGPVMPTFDARIVDADGNPLPTGETGELVVKGAPVIRGYLNRPEATAETIVDGWLHTGDVARLDADGFVYIVDRLKDMVLRGGENVYCTEVESALFEHDAVAECVVFGVPDARLGEEIGAAVVPKAGHAVTAEALRAHCAARISRHKIPRYIWIREESLPRNANGKFLKRELREALDPKAAA